jgi:hypothetical protein
MASFEEVPTLPLSEWLDMFDNGSSAWSSGSRPWQMNPQFDRFIPHVCELCRRGTRNGVKLTFCDGCRVAAYCCKAHKDLSKPKHQMACEAMQQYNAKVSEEPPIEKRTSQTHKDYLLNGLQFMSAYCRQLPGGNSQPNPFQNELIKNSWIFQRHCSNCFTVGSKEGAVLVDCKICHQSAHCSNSECATAFSVVHSDRHCENNLINSCSLVMAMQQGRPPISVSSDRAPPNSVLVAAWGPYMELKLGAFEIPPQMLEMPPVMAMLTDALSMPLTILHGLGLAYGTHVLSALETVEVFIVGAEGPELIASNYRYEEIAHWLPALRSLIINFVGPAVPPGGGALRPCQTCPACATAGCKIFVRYFPGLMHEVFSLSSLTSNTPDPEGKVLPAKLLLGTLEARNSARVALAAHSGMFEILPALGVALRPKSEVKSPVVVDPVMVRQAESLRSSWFPTLALLASADVPLVCTEYTALQMEGTQFALHTAGLSLIKRARKNPFKGLRPFPEPFLPHSFYYSNQFLCVARGVRVIVPPPIHFGPQGSTVSPSADSKDSSNGGGLLVTLGDGSTFSVSVPDESGLQDWADLFTTYDPNSKCNEDMWL